MDLRTVGGCLFDLDGTIYQAGELIAGADQTLAQLRAAEVPYRFVTNTTRKPRREIVAHLGQVGIAASEDEVLTAPIAAAAWLKTQQAQRILEETYANKRLAGWRGSKPGDREAVLDIMRRMAQLACDFPQIQELEINPLYAMPEGTGAYALDIRGSLNS